MNGVQEMVNKYHKKSPQHFTDDMAERREDSLMMTLWKYLINFWQIN